MGAMGAMGALGAMGAMGAAGLPAEAQKREGGTLQAQQQRNRHRKADNHNDAAHAL
jgi:hypothetical protein